MKYSICLIIYFSFLFSVNEYDNIFEIKSSPRNIAIGNIHSSTNNISSIFDSPLNSTGNNKNLFISINNYNNMIDVYHFAYSLMRNNKMNLTFGIVRREINNNFNTLDADIDNGYPHLSDIDYTNITTFNDKQTGILLSYNRKMTDNFVLGINFKPEFHNIIDVSAVGFRLDVRYLFIYKNYDVIIAMDNLLAVKKWDTGLLEKNNLNSYLSISTKISNHITFLCEYNLDKKIKLGTEFEIIDEILLRFGLSDSNLSAGFGFNLKNIDIDYAYIDNKYDIFGNNHIIGFTLNLKDFY